MVTDFIPFSFPGAIPTGAVGQPGTDNKPPFKSVPSQAGARAQLRISGLFPSAYWCGQALVDIPLCWILLFSMFGLQFAISNKVSGSASIFFLLVNSILVCLEGIGGKYFVWLRHCGCRWCWNTLDPLIDLLVSPSMLWVPPAGHKRQ